jgi:hypothetical protein
VSADIVAVLPQFRGYSFFATRNDLVIVEPGDKRVVALVPLNTTQTASRPHRDRSTERTTQSGGRAAERSAARSSRAPQRETVGAAAPTEQEILNAPLTGSGRAQTRVERDDEDTVVIERHHHRPRVFGIFRF